MTLEQRELLRGNTLIRALLAGYLKVKMEHLIDVARLQWEDIDSDRLPYPKRYDAYDPLQTKEWPTVGANIVSDGNYKRVDITEYGDNEYQARYRIRLFCWVRTPKNARGKGIGPYYDTCMKMRDDMGAILKAALLDEPGLGTTDEKNEPQVMVMEETLQTEYFDATRLSEESGHYSAGVSINFDLDVQESLWREASGIAHTIDIAVDQMTPAGMEP